MDSSEKDDSDGKTDEDAKRPKEPEYDYEQDQWDEWYDDGESQNKNFRIRRSKRRLEKQRDE